MALREETVFTPAVGHIFIGESGQTMPTLEEITAFQPSTPEMTGWENIGYTPDEELPSFGFDGGDTETLGTWQKRVFREIVTEPASDYVTFNCHQFDETALRLYYGAENTGEPGVFAVSSASTDTMEHSLLIIITDRQTNIAFYAPRCSIRREEAVELDIEALAYLPLRATFLEPEGDQPIYAWIHEGINAGS